uniref:Uncharacterized protein n=1 Tax=Rhizophora mucronata TaxID=61149 RepID=A0A2P2Q167_RHIMU
MLQDHQHNGKIQVKFSAILALTEIQPN